MIEKFDDQNGFCMADCMDKINEVIDAVNTIQKEREAEWFEIQEWIGILEAVRKSVNIHEKQIDKLQMKVEPEKCEAPADPYAEYRGWAGKLCRFWNIDKDKAIYGILEEVKADWAYRFQAKGEQYLWDHCEPVKPDDDIIYKGE